ncbi:unnamed protein product [Cylicocyclus nassatus]|uniref:Uncharacterized protein n=1 Tax=Cylicocyclus nassatus TaxID=53992 RepID=A0AA36HCJ3_CYLNA|nr:unnamed protein product [Cylicocyclus nassatus]
MLRSRFLKNIRALYSSDISSVHVVLLVAIIARTQALKCYSGLFDTQNPNLSFEGGKTVFGAFSHFPKEKIMLPLVTLLMLMLLSQVTVEWRMKLIGKCFGERMQDPQLANTVCFSDCTIKHNCKGGGHCTRDDWLCECAICP